MFSHKKLKIPLTDCGKRELELYSCNKCIFSTHLLACYKTHVTNSRCRAGEHRNLTYQTFYTKEYSCSYCPFKTYSLLVSLRHAIVGCNLSKIKTRKKKCGLCLFTCTSDKKLRQHIKKVFEKLGCVLTKKNYRDWFICKFCGFQHGDKNIFVEHIMDEHEHLITDKGLRSHLIFEYGKSEVASRWLKCEFCEFKCGEEDIMKLHEEKEHEHQMYSVIRKENNVMLQCKLCKFSTDQTDCIVIHIKNNHIKGPF